jgi:streptogramin lyase
MKTKIRVILGTLLFFSMPVAGCGKITTTTAPPGRITTTTTVTTSITMLSPFITISTISISLPPFPDSSITFDALEGTYMAPITLCPAGNLWFTEANGNTIDKISQVTGDITNYEVPTDSAGPNGISAGPDGNLGFAETHANKIGKISPNTGNIEFNIPTEYAQPAGIVTGSGDNLWFTKTIGEICEISPLAGAINEYPVGN